MKVELGRTALIAIAAGERRENDTDAKRSEPAGTGVGGWISAKRPYGFTKVRDELFIANSAYSEERIKHFLRDIGPVKLDSQSV